MSKKRRSRSPVNLLNSRMKAVTEDFRKVGVTASSAGLVGLIITGDTITVTEAIVLLMLGIFFWVFAMILLSKGE